MSHELLGVVERDGDGYVGTCDEVGTRSYGHTVEQAFENLREATWSRLEQQQETTWATSGADELLERTV